MTALPQLDGFAFRHFAGDSDFPHFARIINAHARGEGNDRVETAESMAAGYAHMERCDPSRDLVVVEADGEPVAYGRVSWDQETDGPLLYRQVCFVDPAYVGRGIGSTLLAWNEARLREIAAEHDGADRQFEIWVNDANARATALVRANGFEAVTYGADMVRPSVDDLPDHRLPDGLELRPVTEEQLREIWDAEVEAFRDHWSFIEPTEADYQRFLTFPYNDLSLWKVAWDEEGVAGQVRSYVDPPLNAALGRNLGYTENISTARRWRRRGVAKALIVESIRELARRGITEVRLGVHTENPNGAYDLYAALGYEVVTSWTTYRKPV